MHRRRYVIGEVKWMVDDIHAKRKTLQEAEESYHEAMWRAVRAFTERGVPYRDQAEMLGVSHQYIAKIVRSLIDTNGELR
jgi:hypothetical protein